VLAALPAMISFQPGLAVFPAVWRTASSLSVRRAETSVLLARSKAKDL
jgi:hypothetical protein